jgi:hypothetical protein
LKAKAIIQIGAGSGTAAEVGSTAYKVCETYECLQLAASEIESLGWDVGSNSNGIYPQLLDGNYKWGLIHIMDGHWYNTEVTNNSVFLESIDIEALRQLVSVFGGNSDLWIQEGNSLVRIMDVGFVIGYDGNGVATTWMKVVTDLNGVVTTAYPVSSP